MSEAHARHSILDGILGDLGTGFEAEPYAAKMERPPSQLENLRPSGLKPPSKVPTMSAMASSTGTNARTLAETSQSDLNAKTAVQTQGQGSLMGPPAAPNGMGIKHRIPGRE